MLFKYDVWIVAKWAQLASLPILHVHCLSICRPTDICTLKVQFIIQRLHCELEQISTQSIYWWTKNMLALLSYIHCYSHIVINSFRIEFNDFSCMKMCREPNQRKQYIKMRTVHGFNAIAFVFLFLNTKYIRPYVHNFGTFVYVLYTFNDPSVDAKKTYTN